jgi:hypothetical protein
MRLADRALASTGPLERIHTWKTSLSEVKHLDKIAGSRRDEIKDLLEAQDADAKVLDYIARPEDAGPSHGKIVQSTNMNDEQLSSSAGTWFVDSYLKPWISAPDQADRECVLWLHGTGQYSPRLLHKQLIRPSGHREDNVDVNSTLTIMNLGMTYQCCPGAKL